MESIVFLALLLGVLSTVIFFLRVTAHVAKHDPAYTLKALAIGFLSAGVGYMAKGHVEIKLVVWGIGGVALYALFKLIKN